MTLTGPGFAIAARIIIALICATAAFSSWKVAQADHFVQQDTAESLRSAVRLVPDDSDYYFRLGQLDEEHAGELFATALRLNQYNAHAAIELGLRDEADGDYCQAEKLLLHAAVVDRTYLPRWSLTNFYLRRDNIAAFWAWARKSAEMPSEDIGALFNLCWRVSPDPDSIARHLLNNDPELIRQYLDFLLDKNQLPAAGSASLRLAKFGSPGTDRTLLLSVVDRLVAANDAASAGSLWRELSYRHWVVADTSIPNNPRFSRDPLPVSFDWTLAKESGLHSWPGPSGLETEFTGDEAENCVIAEQTVILSPGNYAMKYTYHTKDIAPDTGIRWQLINARTGALVSDSGSLSSDSVSPSALPFSVEPDGSLLKLRLVYKRTLGTPRISGTLVVISIEIQRAA